MPKYANNVSAFTLRVEPGRRQEEYGYDSLVSFSLAFPNIQSFSKKDFIVPCHGMLKVPNNYRNYFACVLIVLLSA